jgi:hypothetical protein
VKNLSALIPAGLIEDVSDALDPTGVTWVPLVVDVVLLAIALPWMLAAFRRRARYGQALSPYHAASGPAG